MWRDRWLALGIIGTVSELRGVSHAFGAARAGAISLGAWTGHLDAVLSLLPVGFGSLAVYRYWTIRRRTP